MNDSFFSVSKIPLGDPVLRVTGELHSGWISSPTITTIAIFLGILIGWNLILTWKIWKKNKFKRTKEEKMELKESFLSIAIYNLILATLNFLLGIEISNESLLMTGIFTLILSLGLYWIDSSHNKDCVNSKEEKE